MAKGKRSKKAKNRKSKLQKIISEQHQANVSMNESDQDIQQAQSSQHSCLQNKNEEDNLESVEQPVAIQDALHKTQNSQHSSLQNKNEEDNLESVEQPIAIQGEMQDVLHKTVENQSDTVVSINSLPEDLLTEIFQYLNFKERSRLGRVCKKWYDLIRNQVSWQSIAMNISKRAYLNDPVAIGSLPSYITYMSLSCDAYDWSVDSREISLGLEKSCPNLKTLIFHYVMFCCHDLKNFCCEIPSSIRVLVLHHCKISDIGYRADRDISELEVLDVSHCDKMDIDPYDLPEMPNLKRLRLARCNVHDDLFKREFCSVISNLEVLDLGYTKSYLMTFQMIRSYAFNLTELYLCSTRIDDRILILNICEPALKKLKVLCLRNCDVTIEGLEYLLSWCPSLLHVYVGSNENVILASHYETIISEKVHVISGSWSCNHRTEIDCRCA